LRRIYYVPVTTAYAGEQFTSVAALAEALARGLIEEPRPALFLPALPTETGLWRNLPVVPPGMMLEVGPTASDQVAATEVYGRGYRVSVFSLGGAYAIQPLKRNEVPIGQESRLLSGVPTGTPPAMPVVADSQPVFQYGIPGGPVTTDFTYTPVATALDVRLASVDTDTDGIVDSVLPSAITSDAELFRRDTSCSRAWRCRLVTGYFDKVAGYTLTTTTTNRQIQFVEGSP